MRTIADRWKDSSLAERGLVEELVHPVTGRRSYYRNPVVVDGQRLDSTRPAPVFAQHTDEVLREWLGLSDGRLADLRKAEVIGTTPASRRA